VSTFGEYQKLHLESSKQNYYIISLRVIIKAIFTSLPPLARSKPPGSLSTQAAYLFLRSYFRKVRNTVCCFVVLVLGNRALLCLIDPRVRKIFQGLHKRGLQLPWNLLQNSSLLLWLAPPVTVRTPQS